MAPPLCMISEDCFSDMRGRGKQVIDLDYELFSMNSLFPFQSPSTFNTKSYFPTSPVDPNRNPKRQKPNLPSTNGSCISTTTINGNGGNIPKLRFRDHVWAYNQRFLAIEAMEEASAAIIKSTEANYGLINEDPVSTNYGEGMKLVQQLIACAEAVACRDRAQASALLPDLRANALVFGTSFQRVASCFVQGLTDRIAPYHLLGGAGIVGLRDSNLRNSNIHRGMIMAASKEKDEALNLVYEICPHLQFAHFIANSSILEAFEGQNSSSSLHVIDLGMTQGLSHGPQWRRLIEKLAGNQLCHLLRITGVGNSGEQLIAIGDELKQYAKKLGLEFSFMVVEKNLEVLKKEDFHLIHGEVLVINSILQLHCGVKESRGALNSVLQMLQEISPRLFVLIEQESSHNGPFFLGRFMEALHYYSAIFDSLDAMLPKYDTKRAKMEQFYFAEEIKNIVSCEGPARVERHEKIEKWRRRMSRAGFVLASIKMITQAKQWVKKFPNVCEGYMVVEEKGCMVLGWKSKPIIAASCWKCSRPF